MLVPPQPSPLERRPMCREASGDGCTWCHRPIPPGARADARFCQKVCRQAAFRLRRRRAGAIGAATPGRFAYADPPFLGLARRYYGKEPTFAGEVDHAALIAELVAGGFTGWALSTDMASLQQVLALCPPGVVVRPWVKPLAPDPEAYGPTKRCEALIICGGRALKGARVRDWLLAAPARLSGERKLPGRKPLKFCAWLFAMLGMLPGDELVDLFPGTAIVSRAWAELSRPVAAAGATAVRRRSRRSSTDDGIRWPRHPAPDRARAAGSS